MIRTRDAEKLKGWQSSNQRVRIGSFAETAAHGEMVFNATNGAASLQALTMAGPENLKGKILIDVSNPLDFSSWTNIFDLGDLSTARGTEAYMLLWVRLFRAMNAGMFNIKIMK